MLIGDVYANKNGVVQRHITLQGLIDGLAPAHTSRYPITVESNSNTFITFRDSRFPKDALVILRLDDSDGRVTIDCSRIANNKFRESSSEYTTRTTSDLAKMRKWLREYVQPYSPAEIVQLTFGTMKVKFAEWADHYSSTYREAYMNVNTMDVIQDLVAYLGGGRPYSTGRLARFATQEFREQMVEHERRRKSESPKINLFMNPDGICWMSTIEVGQFTGCSITNSQVIDSADGLPIPVKEKYSMLKLVDNDTYIENVGVRLSHNNFWLYE